MYAICGVVMKGKVPNYAVISPEELQSTLSLRQIEFAQHCTLKLCT